MENIIIEQFISELKKENFDENLIMLIVAEIKRDKSGIAIFMYMYQDLQWTTKEIAEFFMGLSTFVLGAQNNVEKDHRFKHLTRDWANSNYKNPKKQEEEQPGQ